LLHFAQRGGPLINEAFCGKRLPTALSKKYGVRLADRFETTREVTGQHRAYDRTFKYINYYIQLNNTITIQ
jgi:hypothetical protein